MKKRKKGDAKPMGTTIAGIKVYNIQETAKVLGINRVTVYKLLRAGKLKGEKFGYGWKVSLLSIKAFVSGGVG